MAEKRKAQIIPASAELRQKAVNFRRGIGMKLSKKDIRRIEQFIYPYLNTASSGEEASGDANYGMTAEEFLPPGAVDSAPQPKKPASGPNGGNRQLWDVMVSPKTPFVDNPS